MVLGLSAEEVLTTTRGVRRRLDVTRPVDRQLLVDCARVAQQAPSGRNRQRWDFLFVTDPGRRAHLADLWRLGLAQPTGDDDTAPSRQGRWRTPRYFPGGYCGEYGGDGG